MAVEPEFVMALSGSIHGMFWSQAEKFTAADIEREFREAVQDHQLMQDQGFASNLMFMVRKREVTALREDVFQEFHVDRLEQGGRVSTMKTVYALDGAEERSAVDRRLADTLEKEFQSEDGLVTSNHLVVADRIGGPLTLQSMKEMHAQVQQAQRDAQAEAKPDFARIKRLDRVRSALDTAILVLEQKLSVLNLDESERLHAAAEWYVGRQQFHEARSYKLLLAGPASAAIGGIRAALQRVGSVVSPGGLPVERQAGMRRDARLRGLCLLERLGARLTPAESQSLDQHAELIEANPGLYRREYDWEDVLDRV